MYNFVLQSKVSKLRNQQMLDINARINKFNKLCVIYVTINFQIEHLYVNLVKNIYKSNQFVIQISIILITILIYLVLVSVLLYYFQYFFNNSYI